jgi:hypothetical protein
MSRWLLGFVLVPFAAHASSFDLAWQARLVDGAGNAVNGSHDVTVRLYDGSGALLATRPFTAVSFQDGFASLALSAMDTSWFHGEVTVGVALDAGAEWSPRTPLVSVPRAHVAKVATTIPVSTSVSGSCGADGGITWDDTYDALFVCDDDAWRPTSPVTLNSTAGWRQWTDGSLSPSCEDYRRPAHPVRRYQGATGSGVYRIDPDGNGTLAAYDVWCEMDLEEGGWTRVMVHAGQSGAGSSWFWSNSPAFYTTRTSTGAAATTASDTLSYAFNDLLADEVLIARTAQAGVGVRRVLPPAMAGQSMRALFAVLNNTHTYGPADGVLNGRSIGFGHQVSGTQRMTYIDLTQAEMLAVYPATAASDYSAYVYVAMGAYDRGTWGDPWHVRAGPKVAFIDNGTGNGNPCNKLTGLGYSQLNGAHGGGHDNCTSTNSAESWAMYVR